MKKNVIATRAKYDIIPDEKNINKGKAVMCITTGEVFKSAKAAAEHYGINYNSLITQILGNGKTCGGGRGYKGKGMKFCYISEMGYKADDISASIIEMKQHTVSKEDYTAALKRNEELEAELEELKMQTSATKINEDFNTFMEAIENNNRAMEGMMRQLLALAR
jgi:hypothetical protein